MRILGKDKIKPLIFSFIGITIVEIIVMSLILSNQYKKNQQIVNNKISSIIGSVNEKYPNVSESEIVEILNSQSNADKELEKYGLHVQNGTIVRETEKLKVWSYVVDIWALLAFQIIIFLIFAIYLQYRESKINKITRYLNQINQKDYSLRINNMSEGELSKLENELYKITVMLKEEAENSKNDKLKLADSIADISHQLKTPLTSISIMLENLNDNADMDSDIRKNFIRKITKQVEWMKWLVISLLKFSKLDAGAVNFKKEEIYAKKLVQESIKNMSIPLEIKNIGIQIDGDSNSKFYGDFNWEKEAITNIIKNCIEHTEENRTIFISYVENNLYTKIVIKDEGTGISKDELPHIFERFYKGKNSSSDSFGIGLALAKSIIEKDKGTINCSSELGKGTSFEIKYLK